MLRFSWGLEIKRLLVFLFRDGVAISYRPPTSSAVNKVILNLNQTENEFNIQHFSFSGTQGAKYFLA